MGKKGSQGGNLGRTLIKDRYGKKNRPGNSMLHTSEIGDGQEWGRLNLQSITEQTHVEEFLATAELAGTEFQAVKLNVNFVRPTLLAGMPTEEEKRKTKMAQEANKNLLSIPRRPPWNASTTAEQLAEAERSSFLSWRRSLAHLQEVDGITLTPYEKNLEFWRQLWRVIERSDVIVQILDARNPLLFRCEDLEAYVKEISRHKDNLLLINKSDFLTEEQREVWAEYFRKNNIKVVFFSATKDQELDDIQEEDESKTENEGETSADDEVPITENEGDTCTKIQNDDDSSDEEFYDAVEECQWDIDDLSNKLGEQHIDSPDSIHTSSDTSPTQSQIPQESSPSSSAVTHTHSQQSMGGFENSSKLLNREELINVLGSIHTGYKMSRGNTVTIGLVGYPNVGKSSTINTLMQEKKVSVSATPGKTKHFQTLFLSDDIILCDCPGLVFPAFVATKQEMIVSGILPIDQMRDEVPPINLVASRIPRSVFEGMYGITLPKPLEGEDLHRPPTSEELLNTYGFMRGYMTQRGMPDNPRSARYILKDYMNGRLLYCHAPPGMPQDSYHIPTVDKVSKGGSQVKLTPQQLATQPPRVRAEVLDRNFFGSAVSQCHVKGRTNLNKAGIVRISSVPGEEKQKRQKNFKKKEKLRRRYAHLDEW